LDWSFFEKLPEAAQKECAAVMKKDFATDRHVMAYLLEITSPRSNNFYWDTRTGIEVESERSILNAIAAGAAGVSLDRLECTWGGCKNFVYRAEAKYCVVHTNQISLDPETATPTQRLGKMLQTPDFGRALSRVFASDDIVAHNQALRLLWIVLNGTLSRDMALEEFIHQIGVHASGPRFTLGMGRALLCVLLVDPSTLVTTGDVVVGLNATVTNRSAWKALFTSLTGSDLKLRLQLLHELTALLQQSLPNSKSLSEAKGWQSMIFSLMTDLTPGNKEADKVFAFCLNLITVIHAEYMMNEQPPVFSYVLTSTFQNLIEFAGTGIEAGFVAGQFIKALVTKITNSSVIFPLSGGYSAHAWQCLGPLFLACRRYVFQTAFWNRRRWEQCVEDAVLVDQPKDEKLSGVRLPRTRIKCTKVFDEPETLDHGFHFDQRGLCEDDPILCDTVLAFFKRFQLHQYQPELFPLMVEKDREFLQKKEREYQFWVDAKELFTYFPRMDIIDGKTITHRRVATWVERFVKDIDNKSSRRAVLNEIAGRRAPEGMAESSDIILA